MSLRERQTGVRRSSRQARMEGVCGRSGNDAETRFVAVRGLHNSRAAARRARPPEQSGRHDADVLAKSKVNEKASFTIKQEGGKEPSSGLGFPRVERELLLSHGRLQPAPLPLASCARSQETKRNEVKSGLLDYYLYVPVK